MSNNNTPTPKEWEEFIKKFKSDKTNFPTPMISTALAIKMAENLLSQQKQELVEEIRNKIKSYRCHMDEVHCSCMDALDDWLENK